MKPIKTLNCGVGSDRIEWHALNLPVFSNQKNVVVLYATNNLLLDLPKDIADSILEIARSFKAKYDCVNIVLCGIQPQNNKWSVNWVSIKEVNQIK